MPLYIPNFSKVEEVSVKPLGDLTWNDPITNN